MLFKRLKMQEMLSIQVRYKHLILSCVWWKKSNFTSRNTYIVVFGEVYTTLLHPPAVKIDSSQVSGLILITRPCLLLCWFNLWIQPVTNAFAVGSYRVNNFMAQPLTNLNQFQFSKKKKKSDKLNTQWILFIFCDLNWFPVLNLYFILIECHSKIKYIFKTQHA